MFGRIASTVMVSGTTLAVYLGVVYTFSSSQSYGSARTAIHLAIGLMDVLILGMMLARPWLGLPAPTKGRSRTVWLVFSFAAFLTLLAVVLLHADYVLARSRGAEDGRTGSLLRLKSYLLATQLLSVFFMARLYAVASGSRLSNAQRPRPADLVLLLLPAVPLANYLARNTEVFSFGTALEYLVFFLVCPLVGFLFLYACERALDAPPVAVPAVAGLAFVFYSMPAVSSLLKQPAETLFLVHFGLAVVIPGLIVLWYARSPKNARTALAVIAACSICVSVIESATDRADQAQTELASSENTQAAPAELDTLLSSPAVRRPDVYLLVYDGLAAPAMMKKYRIDPHVDTALLEGLGFIVYDGAYSTHLASRPSMRAVLDMRAAPRGSIAGDNTAIRFFRAHGYKTHLVLNAYLLSGSEGVTADVVFPPATRRSALGALYRGIGTGEFKAEVVFQDSDRAEWLAAKRGVLSAVGDRPAMLYAHSGNPGHSQNSGTCLTDEQAQYARRLDVARQEMKLDIDTVIQNDPDAIIIVAGDHGPYLTGDCLYMARYDSSDLTAEHLADRYGAMLAIRWPRGERRTREDVRTIQDVFFAVASFVLEDERIWRHRIPAVTVGFGGIPDGAVQDGVVMIGRDRGRPLFGQ